MIYLGERAKVLFLRKIMNKSEIRKQYKQIRNALSQNDRSIFSDIIANKLYTNEDFLKCESLAVFSSVGSEVYTNAVIERALKLGKVVATPKVLETKSDMIFVKIASLDELKTGKYGIKEPEEREDNILITDKNTLILVPGLVYGKNMYRIGYGGGYYDKYLENNSYLSAVGLCFDVQVCEYIQPSNYDVKLDKIITEKNIYIEGREQ